MSNVSQKVWKIIFNFPEYVCWIALVALIILNFSGVIFRYFFNSPFKFGEETTKFLFVWLVMLGTAYAAKRDKHVCFDLLANRLSPSGQKVLNIAIILVQIVLYVVLIYISILLCSITTQRTPVFKLNYRYIYSSVAVSGVYFIWYMLLRLKRVFKGQPQDLDIIPNQSASRAEKESFE